MIKYMVEIYNGKLSEDISLSKDNRRFDSFEKAWRYANAEILPPVENKFRGVMAHNDFSIEIAECNVTKTGFFGLFTDDKIRKTGISYTVHMSKPDLVIKKTEKKNGIVITDHINIEYLLSEFEKEKTTGN